MLTAERSANQQAAQRQAERSRRSLPDRGLYIEKSQRDKRTREQVSFSYGNFLASLIQDGWWVTITLRDRTHRFTVRGKRTLRGKIKRHYRDCRIRYGWPDGKIAAWRPASSLNHPWSPFTYQILAELRLFMELLEKAAGAPVGYIVAEEIGELNGRWHLHLLISGVAHLYRKPWWYASLLLWGRTRIDRYDPHRAAAFYVAKYAAKQLGAIHLCGTLREVSMENCETPRAVPIGRHDVAISAAMSSDFFHSPVGSYRKPQFAGTLPGRVWRQRRKQNWLVYEAAR